MIHQTNDIDKIVQLLIHGECVHVKDEQKKEVQKRLIEIKKNCSIVLSQIKNF